MQQVKCDYSNKITNYVTNSLPDPEAEDVEAHLQTCSACCRSLATLMETGSAPPWLAIYRESLRDNAEILRTKRCVSSLGKSPQDTSLSDCLEKNADILDERYRLVRRIGEGGMGSVWEGWDEVMRRRIAIKRLHSSASRSIHQQRLLQEASSLARLSHPHIVSIYEILFRDDEPALIMEYVDGPSLARWRMGKVIGERQAARLIEQLALALSHAHECGVIHRDLKPANILLHFPRGGGSSAHDLDNATAKLTDFGIARLVDGHQITRTGDLLGTPAYMAPEQTLSDPSAIGCGTDVYGLGAVLYELLTGAPPHVAEDPVSTLALVRDRDPVPPRSLRPELSRDIETICLKSMSKRLADRYSSASEMAADLNRFLAGRPIVARPPGPLGVAVLYFRRNKLRAVTLAIAVSCLLTLFLGSLWFAKVERSLRIESDQAKQRAIRAESEAKIQTARAEQALDAVQDNFRIGVHALSQQVAMVHANQPSSNALHPSDQKLMEQSLALYRTFLTFLPGPEAWDLEDSVDVIRYIETGLIFGVGDDLEVWLDKFVSSMDRIQQENVDNPQKHWPIMIYYQVMSKKASAAGNFAESADWCTRYAKLMENVTAERPDDILVRREAAHGWMNAAANNEQAGRKQEAISNAARSVHLYRKLIEFVGDSEVENCVFVEKLLWQAKMTLLDQDRKLLAAIEVEMEAIMSRIPEESPLKARAQSALDALQQLKVSLAAQTEN